MGANHAGEIAYLSRLTRSTVALISNASTAHLEGLGSIDGVARAKGEIFEGLVSEGSAVINVDDPYAELWLELAGDRSVTTFGIDNDAADVRAAPQDIRATVSETGITTQFKVQTADGIADVFTA